MAAPVVAAIDALEATLEQAVQQSKIVQTIDREISRALGLLVDLILLPFLPLLVGAILQLYSGIIGFGKWWNDVTSVLKTEGLLGLIRVTLEAGAKIIDGWIENLLKLLFGSDSEKAAAIDGFIRATLDFTKLVFGATYLPQLLEYLYGGSAAKAISDIFATVSVAIKYAMWIVEKIVRFIFDDDVSTARSLYKFAIDLIKGAGGFLWSVVEFIFSSVDTALKKAIDLKLNLEKGGSSTAWDVAGALLSATGPTGSAMTRLFGSAIKMMGFAEGGVVPGPIGSPQIAVVHGGETITPPGKQQGGNTFNFYGLQADELPEKVRRILRQEGSGYVL